MMKTVAASMAVALTAIALPALAQQAAKPAAAAAPKAATDDRYIGYYYPKPTSTEVFESSLQTIPGVGKRFAERIVVECREGAATLAAAASLAQPARSPLPGPSEEAVSALVNLGYRRPEAERAVHRVARNGESLEDVIRAALQGLAG